MSQRAIILEHLQAGKSITPLEAFHLCGTLALHSLISELRKDGHDIVCQIVKVPSGKHVGRYTLEEKVAYG